MMKLRPSHIRAFSAGRGGNVALIFAFVLPVMVGVGGLVIDFGAAVLEKNTLMTSAEAAALATASYIGAADRSAALATAQLYARQNRPTVDQLVTNADLEFGKWENGAFTVDENANAVRVTASRTTAKGNSFKTSFAKLFGSDFWEISASAIALANPMCILILHPDHSNAFDIDPGAQIDAPDCGVQVNSKHHSALEIGSSSYVNVSSIRVVGGVGMHSTATVRPAPMTGAVPVADPYASLAPPVNETCGGAKLINKDTAAKTIEPSFAFCKGLTIDDASVTLSPGVYVIKGPLTLKNGASIKGNDVIIYMDGLGSDIFFHSKTSFELKAPTTGPYAGMVLWSDKRNTHDHDIYSKFGASAEGTIYAPSSQVEFENDVVWEANCIRIIVSRLELDNDSKYRASNPNANCSNNVYKGTTRLVR
ncbi:pilus assembly protein TadG-related protein [Methylobacterium sp. CM6247]